MNDRISALITALGIKKVDFAKRLNISQSFVSDMCSGKSKPSDRTIVDICRKFNVNEKWLRTGKEEMFDQRENATIERLCTELHASELEAGILRAYFRIDPKIREPFMQKLLHEIQAEYPSSSGTDEDSSAAPAGTQGDTIEPERIDADIAAKVAELARQNQEMAEEIAALKEEDAQLEEAERSSASIPSGRETKLA